MNKHITTILEEGFSPPPPKHPQKILLEFVSANPTGPLHIGHARGAILGEAIANIGLFLGHRIDKEYYINDAGNQIALLGQSLQIAYKPSENGDIQESLQKSSQEPPQDYYRGAYLTKAMEEIKQEYGQEIFTPMQFDKLCEIGKDKMMALVRSNLCQLGVSFDFFVSEKTIYKQADKIIERLKKHPKATYKKGDKLWIASSLLGDEKDRVILKDDGTPTYLAGDIIYHSDKFERHYDSYINIWGADHHGYIARVKASMEFLGYDKERLEIILSQMVSLLKDGLPYKMSKRKGTFILISDVLEDIDADELKFIFLSKKCDTHLEFDMAALSKQDASNPIFYIQYAHTRITSLFKKSTFSQVDVIDAPLEELYQY